MVAEESSEEEEEADDADDAAEKVDLHNGLYHRSANTALQSDDSDEGSDDEEAKRAKEERRKTRAEKKAAKKAAKKEKKLAKKIAKQVREQEEEVDDDDNGTDGMGQAKKKTVVEDGDKVRVMSSHLAELTLLCRRAVTERERRTMHLKKKKLMMTRKPRLRSALKSIQIAMTRLSRPRLKRFGECG